MPEPSNITELRRFLGMTNQLSKIFPKLAETSKPLRDLLSKRNMWSWEAPQRNSFNEMKRILSNDVWELAHYDPEADTRVSADVSLYGLGAVLEQRQKDKTWRPVAYQLRSLSEWKQRYAQIEKEAMAITWVCERFNSYLLGKSFQIQTDYKPLIYLFSSGKDLDCLPSRVQRFRLRLMRYQFSITHVLENTSDSGHFIKSSSLQTTASKFKLWGRLRAVCQHYYSRPPSKGASIRRDKSAPH